MKFQEYFIKIYNLRKHMFWEMVDLTRADDDNKVNSDFRH